MTEKEKKEKKQSEKEKYKKKKIQEKEKYKTEPINSSAIKTNLRNLPARITTAPAVVFGTTELFNSNRNSSADEITGDVSETEEETSSGAAKVVVIVAVSIICFVTMLYLCHRFDIFNERGK